ncbi:MAG: fructosamine kinase family protein [Methylohalobius crimeensis]
MSWREIEASIRAAVGHRFEVAQALPLSGGCIHSAYQIRGGGEHFFVKLAEPNLSNAFAGEAEGLRMLSATGTVRVPLPICEGKTATEAYLVLEYLHLKPRDSVSDRRLGEQLAALHAIEQPAFGWTRDNFIGATPQPNELGDDWVEFWRRRRLGWQLQLAAENGYGGRLQRLGERLLVGLDRLLADYRPRPVLLHGDLWSGNAAMTDAGVPVIFDPACYWGDRETDLAMTELFGGFSGAFYDAYESLMPRWPGYETRSMLYNLYHVLNHLNLFGGGYLRQAETLLERLLMETG